MINTLLSTAKRTTITDSHELASSILTPQVVNFIIELHDKFDARRQDLLQNRKIIQEKIDGGLLPDFRKETHHIRMANWQVAPYPLDLADRRVEITGPVDRKMVINALNSGANVFMADFEDSTSPTWKNLLQGQINLRDAVNGTITFDHPKNGKHYRLKDRTATLMVRPRGWHLVERNFMIDHQPISGSFFDFGVYFYHNAHQLISQDSGPYFYLPKLENHEEARLWNDVFIFSQRHLGIPIGTIKATVLIETILASFELHEILYELRNHSAGLNCGRWDYIFSFIKKFGKQKGFLLPDRSQVDMNTHFMKAYSELVVQTCHKRGTHAIGGMAAQIPIKNDPEANLVAMTKIQQDKTREVMNGHDGTWVAHPGLVEIAKDIFDKQMPQANQIENKRLDVSITAQDLLKTPVGTITEEGVRININVGILYIESWLRGTGAAAIYHLMEDAATAEISRTQIWQWMQKGARLEDGRRITYDLYRQLLPEELDKIEDYVGEEAFAKGRFQEAIELFDTLIKQNELIQFLTLPAYSIL